MITTKNIRWFEKAASALMILIFIFSAIILSMTVYAKESTMYGNKEVWSKYTYDDPDYTLPTPVKTGYTFAGWTGSNGDTPQTTVKISAHSTGEKSYTANWVPNALVSGQDFDYTGNVQTFTAPVTGIYKLECWGAQGGNDANHKTVFGGYGGYSVGTITLIKNTSLYIFVGEKGKVVNSLVSNPEQFFAWPNGGRCASHNDANINSLNQYNNVKILSYSKLDFNYIQKDGTL